MVERLSSIEKFHLFDSSDEFPNVVLARLRYRGSFDAALAERAWERVMARHQWASGPVVESDGSKFSRQRATNNRALAAETFTWTVCKRGACPDLATSGANVNEAGMPKVSPVGPGYRLWCISDGDITEVLFAVHHRVTDGAGAIGAVRQWLAIYDNLESDRPAEAGIGKLDHDKWLHRSQLGFTRRDWLTRLPMQWIAVFGAAKFVWRKFAVVVNVAPGPKDKDGVDIKPLPNYPGIVGRWVDEQSIEALKTQAAQMSVSENSLLLTHLFRLLGRWREAGLVETTQSKWWRIIIPISIRTLADRNLPLANRATLVQVDRTDEQVTELPAAAKGIDREMKIIGGFRLDRTFLMAVKAMSIWPWLLRRVAGNKKPRGSIIFTNLGAPFRKTRHCDFIRVGGCTLVDFDLCGPVRRGTPMNIIFQRHDAMGRVTMHYDRRIVSESVAGQLLDDLVGAIGGESTKS